MYCNVFFNILSISISILSYMLSVFNYVFNYIQWCNSSDCSVPYMKKVVSKNVHLFMNVASDIMLHYVCV